MIHRFGDLVLDTDRYVLSRAGTPEHVEPQVFEVLAYLLAHRHRVVPKQELLDAVWGDRFVSESALTSRLKAARRAVGDSGADQHTIRTVIGRGYQFVAPVATDDQPVAELASSPPPTTAPLAQTIRFCTATDGTRIAYASTGSGPPLVKAANWMTHLEADLDSLVWSHWVRDLSARHRLIRYDERGCGLSDWEIKSFAFDDWVDDLRLVVDSAGLERFPLLGISQGAAVAVAFAARFPERVSHLVLVGSYARGRMARARDDRQRHEAYLDLELARVGWQRDDPSFRQVFASQFFPDAGQDVWEAFNELQRRTTSASNATEFLTTFGLIDVTADAPLVRCPTLIVHSSGDVRQPLAEAREFAATIPGSELVTLPTNNHIVLADEPSWPRLLDAVERFLATPAT